MKNLAVFLIVPFLFACTKEELSSPSQSLEGGVWKASCSYAGSSTYDISKAYFSQGQFVQSQVGYVDSYCSTPVGRIDATGTYVISEASTSILNSRGNLDWKLATLTLTPLHSAAVTQYNSSSYCGYSDWAMNVPKVIMGRSCGGNILGSLGDVTYDIFSIATTTLPQAGIYEGEMNFGYNDSTYDGSAPSKRPVATNGGRIFRRYSQ